MSKARSLLMVAAIGLIASSAAHASTTHHRHRLSAWDHAQPVNNTPVISHQRTIPSFSGGCNPALHVRFGWCPSREFMWNHMWDEGKPLPDNSQYLNR